MKPVRRRWPVPPERALPLTPWRPSSSTTPHRQLDSTMARVVVGSYMVRYPLGGMMSYVLQYLVGFSRLGHDVWFVEKAGYPKACFDPSRNEMTDDCMYGAHTVD